MQFNRRALVLVAAALLVTLVAGEPAAAQCLSPAEQRAAVRSGAAVRPGVIRRAVPGELLNLQLCRQGGRLVYRATVIRPNGAVRTMTIDAGSGAPMGN